MTKQTKSKIPVALKSYYQEVSLEKACGSRHTAFCATVFNFTEDHLSHMKKYAPKYFDRVIFQLEKAPTTNQLHLQFYGSLKKERTVTWLKKEYFVISANIEKVKSSEPSSILYCSKRDTYVEGGIRYNHGVDYIDFNYNKPIIKFEWGLINSGDTEEIATFLANATKKRQPRSKGQGSRSDLKDTYEFIKLFPSLSSAQKKATLNDDYKMLYQLDKYKGMIQSYYNSLPMPKMEWFHATFYPWQQSLLDIVNSPADSRTIIFILDYKGHSGKTDIYKYLIGKYNAFALSSDEKSTNLLYDMEPLIVLDCPRISKNIIAYPYLEQMKDGYITSTKYMAIRKFRKENAHVIVFMNDWPDHNALSVDRYKIFYVTPETKELESIKYISPNHPANNKYFEDKVKFDKVRELDYFEEDRVVIIN